MINTEMLLDNKSYQEQLDTLSFNLGVITLYSYQDRFILVPNTIATKIKNNLVIFKSNSEIVEASTNQPLPHQFTYKSSYSAFLGILSILNKTFLMFIETCEKVCSIDKQDIFELRSIELIPCRNQQKEENANEKELNIQVENYIIYMKNYLMKEGYYFSYEYDLSLSRQAYAKGYPTRGKYHWNLNMSRKLLQLQDKAWFVGLMQGSIKFFKVFIQGKKMDYYLITRRSWKKGGTRYNSRGIDSKGHVANFCQTEQLIFINSYCFSHIQIRGSVPAFWKQSGIYAEVEFYKDHEETKLAFDKHFKKLEKHYGNIFCINLLSKHKSGEYAVTLYYENLISECLLNSVKYEFYDFHFACKGQKFERSDYLIEKINPVNKYFGYYLQNVEEKSVIHHQKGVMRTNCLDCLDRTNLIQSKIAYDTLEMILSKCGFNVKKLFNCQSLLKATKGMENSNLMVINLKNVWADNGDAISKHYTGTGSTHTNVTRTGRRDLKGIMDHGFKTLGRFYKQYMEDNYKQEVIDILIGQHTETINLAEFETRIQTMKADEIQSSEFVEI